MTYESGARLVQNAKLHTKFDVKLGLRKFRGQIVDPGDHEVAYDNYFI